MLIALSSVKACVVCACDALLIPNPAVINIAIVIVDGEALLFFLLPKMILYKTGNTINVNKVDEIKPPITTVANGFCTSEPGDVLNAIGKKPNDATAAVAMTGLNLALVPFIIRSKIFSSPSDLSRLK